MHEDDRPDMQDDFAFDDEHADEVFSEEEGDIAAPLDLGSADGTSTTDGFEATAMPPAGSRPVRRLRHSDDDDAGELPRGTERDARAPEADWSNEVSAARIGAELRHIEQEIKTLLEGRDPKRKRKFAGTRRWLELEEDLLELKFTGRLDEETLSTIQRLVVRRHDLFRRLRFLSGTRPGWNS
jgi:hypothetical protein